MTQTVVRSESASAAGRARAGVALRPASGGADPGPVHAARPTPRAAAQRSERGRRCIEARMVHCAHDSHLLFPNVRRGVVCGSAAGLTALVVGRRGDPGRCGGRVDGSRRAGDPRGDRGVEVGRSVSACERDRGDASDARSCAAAGEAGRGRPACGGSFRGADDGGELRMQDVGSRRSVGWRIPRRACVRRRSTPAAWRASRSTRRRWRTCSRAGTPDVRANAVMVVSRLVNPVRSR